MPTTGSKVKTPISPATKAEVQQLAGDLWDMRNTQFKAQTEAFYWDAQNIWYILGLLAGLLDPTVIDDASVFQPPANGNYPAGITEANLQARIDELLHHSNPVFRHDLALICKKLHRQICGHCACG